MHVLASSAVGTPARLRFATISVEGYLRSSRSRKVAFPSDEWIRHGRGTRNNCYTSNESQSDADRARDLGDRRGDGGGKRLCRINPHEPEARLSRQSPQPDR